MLWSILNIINEIYLIYICSCLGNKSCLTLLLSHVAHKVPLSMGLFRQKHWSQLPFPSPKELSDPGIQFACPMSPALQVDSLPTEPPGKPGWPLELTKINARLARAAVTDTTNWWLKWNKLIIPLFWRLEVCDNATGRPVLPSKALRRLSSSSFSFWWFPGLWKHNCSPHRASPCVFVCMSASRFPFYNDIVILEKGPSNDLILLAGQDWRQKEKRAAEDEMIR